MGWGEKEGEINKFEKRKGVRKKKRERLMSPNFPLITLEEH